MVRPPSPRSLSALDRGVDTLHLLVSRPDLLRSEFADLRRVGARDRKKAPCRQPDDCDLDNRLVAREEGVDVRAEVLGVVENVVLLLNGLGDDARHAAGSLLVDRCNGCVQGDECKPGEGSHDGARDQEDRNDQLEFQRRLIPNRGSHPRQPAAARPGALEVLRIDDCTHGGSSHAPVSGSVPRS